MALELFARDGFHATTIPDIAEAADVAPRTVSTYFPSKEGIVFEEYETAIERFRRRLSQRADTERVLDVLRSWLHDEEQTQHGPTRGLVLRPDQDGDDFARLRETAIAADPDLWALQRRYLLPMVRLVAEGVAADLGVDPQSLQAQVAGESAVAVLLAVNARAARNGSAATAEFEVASEFLRAGLDTVRPRDAHRRRGEGAMSAAHRPPMEA
ncbi:TetR family transcriptional regulator [Solirubrobacter sp. CPCC 204708]|uniref:TetR/AcrR family transcriptional regulator n=1 Tax=Solirubrobacter deserti TaxID=2282478 RepID=A0ABT4RDE1_9ACTN|nr:TetR family transcriptional regulator [Solirubrobacter deserti]MBE2314533.1 TetR family transcriptional regulator [Solirubrobacter deserti]MDA0136537.1 TetR/AcrR family transcriptional regulator [Solirubrobacter deserti]